MRPAGQIWCARAVAFRGIGLVGAVHALAAAGYEFPRVAGSSAGAVVASMVAALQAAGEPLSRLDELAPASVADVWHSAFGTGRYAADSPDPGSIGVGIRRAGNADQRSGRRVYRRRVYGLAHHLRSPARWISTSLPKSARSLPQRRSGPRKEFTTTSRVHRSGCCSASELTAKVGLSKPTPSRWSTLPPRIIEWTFPAAPSWNDRELGFEKACLQPFQPARNAIVRLRRTTFRASTRGVISMVNPYRVGRR
jgi:hypothetical protein